MATRPNFEIRGWDSSLTSFSFSCLRLRLPGIVADLDALDLHQALIMLPAYSLGVLGDGGVGKTALISRFRSNTFAEEVSASASSIGCFAIEECQLTYYKV